MNYYAHSGKAEESLPPQLYRTHVRNVSTKAVANAHKLLRNASFADEDIRTFILDVVRLSAMYHDMGKLDVHIQPVLSSTSPPDVRLLNHVDAGVAFLLKRFKETNHTAYLVSAFFVLSHHIGLQNWFDCVEEQKPQGFFSRIAFLLKDAFRCQYNIKEEYGIDIDLSLEAYTDSMLDEYLKIQHKAMKEYIPVSKGVRVPLTALQMRMAFSCLIDADHHDTATHFSKGQYRVQFPKLKAEARLKKLDRAVKKLSKSKKTSPEKRDMRNRLYALCSAIPTDESYYLIDSTVGSAKTVASIKAALLIAKARGQERIYSVAPFTNIINQTVDVYRQSILLPKEKPYAINEIHSKVEFEDPRLRMYNQIWSAPVNVTTAVQFIESLVKHRTSSVRKLHLFANSVVILDEFHSFIPHELWNYVLELMRDLALNFNTVFIFSSGSSVLYWDLYEKHDMHVHQIVPNDFYDSMLVNETKRVAVTRHPVPFESLQSFSDTVLDSARKNHHSSVMVVVNTIQNAVALTKHFVGLNTEYQVYHLSSYLIPRDRKKVLNKVKAELGTKKIVLIATSIVECGVDMSFESGYRQVSSLSSIIQFNGRINREQLYATSPTLVFDFHSSMKDDRIVTENPMFAIGKEVLTTLTDVQLTPEYCTEAIARERELRHRLNDLNLFIRLDTAKDFKAVGENFHVISSHTITVIVDAKVADAIRKQEYVSYRRVINNSVQLWLTKLEDPRFTPHIEVIEIEEKEHYLWTGPYDPIFGVGVVI